MIRRNNDSKGIISGFGMCLYGGNPLHFFQTEIYGGKCTHSLKSLGVFIDGSKGWREDITDVK